MHFLKRMWLSIIRRPIKSFLLLLIIFLLGNAIIGAIVIQQSCENIETSIKQKLGAKVTIKGPLNSFLTMKIDEQYDAQEVKKYYHAVDTLSKAEEIEYANYSLYINLYTDAITDSRYMLDENGQEVTPFSTKLLYYPYPSILLWGVSDNDLVDSKEKRIELIEGRSFTDAEMKNNARVILISDAYYRYEDGEKLPINVGDMISFKLLVCPYGYIGNWLKNIIYKEDILFEVIGKYRYNSIKGGADVDQIGNRFYVPNQTVIDVSNYYRKLNEQYSGKDPATISENDFYEKGKSGIYVPNFRLKSVDDLDSFIAKANELIADLPDYRVLASSDDYNKLMAPVTSLNKVADSTLIFATVSSLVILGLVTMLFIKDRKQEIGIYMALGERKRKILTQVILEVLLIGIVGISLSLLSGQKLAERLSTDIINKQVAIAKNEAQPDKDYGVSDYSSSYDPTEHYYTVSGVAQQFRLVSLEEKDILKIYGLSLLVLLLSTLAPVGYTLRIKPKKVLL